MSDYLSQIPSPEEQVHRTYVVSNGVRSLLTNPNLELAARGKWLGVLLKNMDLICNEAALQQRLIAGELTTVIADPVTIREDLDRFFLTGPDTINVHYARTILTARLMELEMLVSEEVEFLIRLGLTWVALEIHGEAKMRKMSEDEVLVVTRVENWVTDHLQRCWQD